jgi:cyclic pyranopterin phosphate synthase
MSDSLTHLDDSGQARMVDVSDKPENERTATAAATVLMQPNTLRLVQAGQLKKGDVWSVARIAGIMGAKQTAHLIPLCHPLPLTSIQVDFSVDEERSAVHITASVRTMGRTGVEMEALTAVTTAALTIYDMAKAVDKGMQITDVRLMEKRGGVHGDYTREETP